MPTHLSMEHIPTFRLASFRQFLPHERHITRVDSCDILLIMLGGVLRFAENGSPVELTRGEYYIQRKGLLQSAPEISECPSYFYIHFSDGVWVEGAPALPSRGVCDADALLPLLRELDDAASIDAPAVVKNGLLCSILTKLFQGKAKSDREILADRIARRLTESLQAPPSLSDLASTFHFSENYLIRIFREAMGITPHAYLNAARLRKAKLLLSSSNMTADRVAYECGFTDYAHFYRMFRQDTGTSPKAYRQRMVNGPEGVEHP